MFTELDIHDALIASTGLVYKKSMSLEVFILTEDKKIRDSNSLPVA